MSDTAYAWLPRITMSHTADESGRVVVSTENGPFIRTSGDVGRILRLAHESYPIIDPEGIAAEVGASAGVVEEVLRSVGASPALTRQATTPKRLEFRRPFSLQFTLLDPSAALGRLPVIGVVARSRAWWVGQIAVAIAGGLLLVVLAITPDSSLHRPMAVGQYVGVFVALFLTVFVHEFAHAAALVAHGGRSHRLGAMLFYLAPAFFCDVSDAWRLRPDHRVRVAMAGILAQTSIATAAALIALGLPEDTATAWSVFAVLCYLYGLFNLLPFVKLDGYIAVVGHLDRPNLRAQAMTAFRGVVGGALIGRHRDEAQDTAAPLPQPPDPRPSAELVLFGAACSLLPIVLVGGAGLAVNAYLASWGPLGAWITIAVLAGIVGLGLVLLIRAAGRTIRAAASRPRALVVVAAAAIVIAAGVAAVPLPQQLSGGLYHQAGEAALVVAGATSTVPVGTPISVYRSAVFPSQRIAQATVTGTERECSVPLEAVAPMTGTGLVADARCFQTDAASDSHKRLPRYTIAVVDSGGVPLPEQIRYLIDRVTG